jgi:preprotein translocase subunit SecF
MKLLKLIPDNTNIKFLRWKYVASAFSIFIVLASILLVAVRGLNFGVDFAGGILVEVGFDQPPKLDALRGQLNNLGLGDVSLQEFGRPTDIAVRLPFQPGGEAVQQKAVEKVRASLIQSHGDGFSFRRVETVGGKVSEELVRDGVLSIILAIIGISLYIWFRFEWQFGVGAILSLIHDVAITMGFYALTQLEFNLSSVAAVLTIVGYSLNDTIVVYDRIRENLRKYRKMDIQPLLDLSVNETLSRTIMTSTAMMLSLLALLFFGGEVIRGFTAAMVLGVLIGTYSSVYIAAPMLLWFRVGADTFVPPDDTAKLPDQAQGR